jgi:hypothetical protein
MSGHFWGQRAYIRCHPNRSTLKGAMKQKANVSHGTLKMDKMVRRGGRLTLCSSFNVVVVHGAVVMSIEKKSDEEAKKKQKKDIRKWAIL